MLALESYKWSVTLADSAFNADADGVKTLFSPGGDPDGGSALPGEEGGEPDSQGVIVYTAEDFDGDAITPEESGQLAIPRRLVFNFSSDTGAWDPESPVIVRGRNGGRIVEETIAPEANGGDVSTVGGFDFIEIVEVPPQPGDGQITIGVSDIVLHGGDLELRAIRCVGSGNLVVKYSNGRTDTLAVTAGQFERIEAIEILSSTSVGVTLYF